MIRKLAIVCSSQTAKGILEKIKNWRCGFTPPHGEEPPFKFESKDTWCFTFHNLSFDNFRIIFKLLETEEFEKIDKKFKEIFVGGLPVETKDVLDLKATIIHNRIETEEKD